MMASMDIKHIGIRVPAGTWRAWKRAALARGLTLQDFIRFAVEKERRG